MRAAIAVTLSLVATAASGSEPVETASGALVCVSPYSLGDGYKAAAAQDFGWMRELGCALPEIGTKAIFLDGSAPEGSWRVRITLPDGAATVYGWACAFRKPGSSKAFGCNQQSVY